MLYVFKITFPASLLAPLLMVTFPCCVQFSQLACRGEEEKSGEQIHSHEALAQIHWLSSTGSDPMDQIHWLRSTGSDPMDQIHWLRSTGLVCFRQYGTVSDLLSQTHWLRSSGSDPEPWSSTSETNHFASESPRDTSHKQIWKT